MTAHPSQRGALYLVPTPLDFGIKQDVPASAGEWLPAETLTAASRITHWITENAKSTRAFLKRVEAVHALAVPLQAQQLVELPRAAHKKGDHVPQADMDAQARALLSPAELGHDVGLVSEAGMPAIADPGGSIVRAAHALGLRVVPLTGPVSLMLALAASGLNGQNFAFVGYVPQEATERAKRLDVIEKLPLPDAMAFQLTLARDLQPSVYRHSLRAMWTMAWLASHPVPTVSSPLVDTQLQAGATLAGAFLAAGLADEVLLYMAPVLLGDQARPLFGGLGIQAMAERLKLEIVDSRMIGEDHRLLLQPVR